MSKEEVQREIASMQEDMEDNYFMDKLEINFSGSTREDLESGFPTKIELIRIKKDGTQVKSFYIKVYEPIEDA